MADDALQEEAAEAAKCWGALGQPSLISHRENAVFSIELPGGPGILRLHRRGYQTPAAIRSELWWCEALAQGGTRVPRAIRGLDGGLTAILAGGRVASVLERADGVMMGRSGVPLGGELPDQIALYRNLGRLVATLHMVTAHLQLPAEFERPSWDIDGLVGEKPLWGRFWEHPVLTDDQAARLRDARAYCATRLQDYVEGGAGMALIHADVLRENVLVHGHDLTLIDFDDCGWGFRMYDLGTALSQNTDEPNRRDLSDAIIDGYGSTLDLSQGDVDMVPVFTALRCFASLGWTMGRVPAGHETHDRYARRALAVAEDILKHNG